MLHPHACDRLAPCAPLSGTSAQQPGAHAPHELPEPCNRYICEETQGPCPCMAALQPAGEHIFSDGWMPGATARSLRSLGSFAADGRLLSAFMAVVEGSMLAGWL